MSRGSWGEEFSWTKDDPDASWNQPQRPRPGRKDTRRWCKGKVGREHTPAIVLEDRWPFDKPCYVAPGYTWSLGCRHHEVCQTCGKVLRPFIPYTECPELGPTLTKQEEAP